MSRRSANQPTTSPAGIEGGEENADRLQDGPRLLVRKCEEEVAEYEPDNAETAVKSTEAVFAAWNGALRRERMHLVEYAP